jgi:folate-binding protein YgfZ
MESMSSAFHGSSPLPHLGVIRVEGEDAATFLHGQLTQDFALLGLSEARLAAWCSAKGRVLASFIGFKRSQGDILLVCPRDVLAAMVKRLSMFVLRAKARISDASDAYVLRGLMGPTVGAVAGQAGVPWSRVDVSDATVVFLYPADGAPCALWVAPVGAALAAVEDASVETWRLAEVRSGIAWVGAAASDAYVPQMLNYESVGGVNFKKGCYPGQEVVARSQFRGTLKRRAVLARSDHLLAPGDELFLAEEPDQPVATVVQAAPVPDGSCEAILSGQISAFSSTTLHLRTATGPVVVLRDAPYPLLADL